MSRTASHTAGCMTDLPQKRQKREIEPSVLGAGGVGTMGTASIGSSNGLITCPEYP